MTIKYHTADPSAEAINFRDCYDAEDLEDAVRTLIDDANESADRIHITRPIRITLIEQTLSDGSKVKNLKIERIDHAQD